MLSKTCPKCNSIFKYSSILKKHMLTTVRCKSSIEEIDDYLKTNIVSPKINSFICNECNSIFTRKSSLQRHENNSKCSKIKGIKEKISSKGIGSISIDELKLVQPELINTVNLANPININNIQNNIQNNTINNNTINNNIINQDNRQITINQPIINIINPFANESIPNLSFDEMLKLLDNVDKPEIEILKLVYSDMQNNNFFKYNMGKQDVSYLTSNNSIDTVQEEQFRQLILKNGVELLKSMLIICIKKLPINESSRIYSRIDNIEKRLKDIVNDNDLTNYLYTHFRQNSKNTKKKITTFVMKINDNPEIKEKFIKTIEEQKMIKYNQNILLTPEIPLSEINKALGDLTKAKELEIAITINDFTFKKYEETSYYKYMIERIKREAIYIKRNSKSNLGDHVELNRREKQIMESIEKMKNIYNNYKQDDLLIIDIPEIYRNESIRKEIENRQIKDFI